MTRQKDVICIIYDSPSISARSLWPCFGSRSAIRCLLRRQKEQRSEPACSRRQCYRKHVHHGFWFGFLFLYFVFVVSLPFALSCVSSTQARLDPNATFFSSWALSPGCPSSSRSVSLPSSSPVATSIRNRLTLSPSQSPVKKPLLAVLACVQFRNSRRERPLNPLWARSIFSYSCRRVAFEVHEVTVLRSGRFGPAVVVLVV